MDVFKIIISILLVIGIFSIAFFLFAIWKAILGNTLITERLRIMLKKTEVTGTKVISGVQRTNEAIGKLNKAVTDAQKTLDRVSKK